MTSTSTILFITRHRKALLATTAGVLVLLVIYLALRKGKAKRLLAQIDQQLAGVQAQGDAGQALKGVPPDPAYNGAPDAALLMQAAGSPGWLGFVSENKQAIFDVLANKTKAQLKSIENALKNGYGHTFETFLTMAFDGCWQLGSHRFGYECSALDQARTIIASAPNQ